MSIQQISYLFFLARIDVLVQGQREREVAQLLQDPYSVLCQHRSPRHCRDKRPVCVYERVSHYLRLEGLPERLARGLNVDQLYQERLGQLCWTSICTSFQWKLQPHRDFDD